MLYKKEKGTWRVKLGPLFSSIFTSDLVKAMPLEFDGLLAVRLGSAFSNVAQIG